MTTGSEGEAAALVPGTTKGGSVAALPSGWVVVDMTETRQGRGAGRRRSRFLQVGERAPRRPSSLSPLAMDFVVLSTDRFTVDNIIQCTTVPPYSLPSTPL
jgi:hypothetical protein